MDDVWLPCDRRLGPSSSQPSKGRARTPRRGVVLSVILCFIWCQLDVTRSEIGLPLQSIERWAELFGQAIYATSARATALTDIQTDYLLMQPLIRTQNGSQLILEMKSRLEKMFRRKEHTLNRLVDVAEKSYARHVMSEKIQLAYPKAKNLTNFDLVKNDNFFGLPVNLSMSSIHVPTNVYDESVAVLNGVAWSEALDQTFQENYGDDPTLSWQYFGSSTGFFRNFPGIRWPKPENEVDLYDCRTRGWYIQAATSPKDMVILLDSSGSMKGLRMEIAKATVEKIVETLSDDDFFNVIKFSETPEYLEPCFNGTMVQATINNRKKVIDTLKKGVRTHNIAYFDKALTEAFELLLSTNNTNQGSQCNKAIMVITDGAPDTYEAIFKHYNWPNKDVRVFTYLIGREVGDPRHVRWMACSNKGYYSHISTLADVHEHVQEYIHVISRPMVIMRANQTVWTNIYRDTSHAEEGIHMTISVAQPVYNIKNATANSGDLLGVMGTDVPLKGLISQIPHHKLGVNGYAFAITNNGYVLFHPDLRPLDKGGVKPNVKPNYNSVDLSEVELIDLPPTQQWKSEDDYKRDMTLRNRMIDRETGSMRMRMKVHFDDMKRAAIRQHSYFYAPIDNTPFSLGIALPDGYGLTWLDGRRSLHESDLSALRSTEVTVADWEYCRPAYVNDSLLRPIELLIKSLERGKDPEYFNKYCDVDLVNSLLFDAEATRGVLANWLKENYDGTMNDAASKNCTRHPCTPGFTPRNGVELVFIGTKAGLTRYLTLTDNLTDPEFISSNKDTVRELYYSRAVENGDGIFTFSVPLLEDKRRADPNNTVVTASTPIVVSVNSQDAVAAVTGFQMKYNKFHEFVLSSTSRCETNDVRCNLTCESEEIECYLLDENGFVLFSEIPEEHLGRFFGEINGALMSKLVIKDNETTEDESDGGGDVIGVFSRVEINDYQGMCSIWRKAHCSARSIFVDPIRNFIASLWWIFRKLILLIVNLAGFVWCGDEFTSTPGNSSSFSSGEYSYSDGDDRPVFFRGSGGTDSSDYYVPDFSRLHQLANNNSELIRGWLNEWRKMSLAKEPQHVLMSWYQNIIDKYGPQVIAQRPCTTVSTLFVARLNVALPQFSAPPSCRSPPTCSNSFSINRVPRTNLMLLVVDSTCDCDSSAGEAKISLQPTELEPSPADNDACPSVQKGERDTCLKLQSDVYRRRPHQCYSYHAQENSTRCGANSRVYQSSVFNLSILLMSMSTVSLYLSSSMSSCH